MNKEIPLPLCNSKSGAEANTDPHKAIPSTPQNGKGWGRGQERREDPIRKQRSEKQEGICQMKRR